MSEQSFNISGLTMGVAASLILPDFIAGRQYPGTEIYDPSRKPPQFFRSGHLYQRECQAAGHMAEHPCRPRVKAKLAATHSREQPGR